MSKECGLCEWDRPQVGVRERAYSQGLRGEFSEQRALVSVSQPA